MNEISYTGNGRAIWKFMLGPDCHGENLCMWLQSINQSINQPIKPSKQETDASKEFYCYLF